MTGYSPPGQMVMHSGNTRRPVRLVRWSITFGAICLAAWTIVRMAADQGDLRSSGDRATLPSEADVLSQVCAVQTCTVVVQLPYTHRTFGSGLLAIVRGDSTIAGDLIVFVDSKANLLRWRAIPGGHFLGGPFEVDRIGHILAMFGAGGPGTWVVVLSQSSNGFEDFGSLPRQDGRHGRRFAGRGEPNESIVDLDNDGIYEIQVWSNDCQPSCGVGVRKPSIYRWREGEYVRDS